MNTNFFILASESPRRKEILKQIGFNFIVIPSCFNEDICNLNLEPQKLAEFLSNEKAKTVIEKIKDDKSFYSQTDRSDLWVLAADTIVVKDNKVLGKPKSISDWEMMLRILSGTKHQVITGWTFTNGKQRINDSEITDVYFRTLSDSEIQWYIDTNEGWDKAGGYAIQEKGMILVEKIEGDYCNVVGLPVAKIIEFMINNKLFFNFISGEKIDADNKR